MRGPHGRLTQSALPRGGEQGGGGIGAVGRGLGFVRLILAFRGGAIYCWSERQRSPRCLCRVPTPVPPSSFLNFSQLLLIRTPKTSSTSCCVLVTDSRLLLRATNPSSEYCVLSYSLVGRLRAVEGEDALQHDGRRHIDVERVHPGHIMHKMLLLRTTGRQQANSNDDGVQPRSSTATNCA